MAQVMAQGDGLDQIFIEPEKTAHGPSHLGDQLDVEYPVGDMVVADHIEDLGLVDVAGVGPGVENPIGIDSKCLAVVDKLRRPPPQTITVQAGQGGETLGLPEIQGLPDGEQAGVNGG